MQSTVAFYAAPVSSGFCVERPGRLVFHGIFIENLAFFLRGSTTIMSNDLEEEMRRALFGPTAVPIGNDLHKSTAIPPGAASRATPSKKAYTKPLSPKLRVTLHVSKEFEGEITVFTHDASTLSTFDAEQRAREAAKKEKYRFFEVVSTVPIG
jgi:hypothetical protein